MTQLSLIFRTLRYYWRTNLAVLLGVAIGTAVIAGALIVGDSVRGSLRQMTLDRLGQIDLALSGSRFFREQVAEELAGQLSQNRADSAESPTLLVAPAILVTATLRYEPPTEKASIPTDGAELRIAGRVNLAGTDEQMWRLLNETEIPVAQAGEVVLNERVAEQLGVDVGSEITLFVDIPQTIPQESLLGERDVDEQVIEFPVTVSGIVPALRTAGRFSLLPNQQLPLNAYVNLEQLQEELDLAEVVASPRNPIARPARVNALLVKEPSLDPGISADPVQQAELISRINAPLEKLWELEDLYLHVRQFPERNYFSLESDRMLIEQSLSQIAMTTAAKSELETSPVLAYLVNEISNAQDPARFSMYSVAAGIELAESPPFGPFLNLEGQPVVSLKQGEIAINEWLAEDLQVGVGDEIVLKYHVVGSRGELPEVEKRYRVGAIVQLGQTPAADPALTPHVEGITDARTLADWQQPFPMKMERITDRDDEYWELHKTTPKLFLPLEEARSLWQSRYGESTSVRVAARPGQAVSETADQFVESYRQALPFTQLGLTMLPVKQQGLQAAQGTQDFTGLFIGFSFFVIAAAVVLIALLFQLGMEMRVRQIGLFESIGFRRRTIYSLLLGEGIIVTLLGVIFGIWLAVWYARLMIYGLTTWWRGAIGTSFLDVYVLPGSLLTGGVIAFIVALPGMALGVRRLLKLSPRARLQGAITRDSAADVREMNRGWKLKTGLACLLVSVLLVLGVLLRLIPATEAFGGFNWHIVCFFLSGFLSLIGALLVYVTSLRRVQTRQIRSSGVVAAARLGNRNIGRNRQRSSVTVILISLASFVVMAVAAGKQSPSNMQPVKNSGNGGFSLIAESARPVLYDLTSPEGQDQLGLNNDDDQRLRELLAASEIYSFRVRAGEDASCLNLYQTRLPTILGVPQSLIERGGFLFADTPGSNPWTLLEQETPAGRIPVLADQNTLQYSLHKAIGNLIEVPAELNLPNDLEVAGALSGSLFQGVLLMSEEHFLKLFPDVSGYQYFLIDTAPEQAEELTSLLESRLVSLGFDVEPTGRRLESFLAVQNTYLSTFQALGGLGLLLGTLGMGTVMLRNVLERRSELALMRAIGFRAYLLGVLVLAENAILLLLGLAIGTSCALLAMLPTISSRGGDFSWENSIGLLAGIFATGMVCSLAAVIEAVRTPVLKTLRSE